MSGGKVHRIQDIRRRRAARGGARRPRERQPAEVSYPSTRPPRTIRTRRKPRKSRTRTIRGPLGPVNEYVGKIREHKRVALAVLVCAGIIALVFAILASGSGAAERPQPVDPGRAGPDTVLAETMGVKASTPIRPESLTGLGYHPEGDSSLKLDPRGRNLSANPLMRFIGGGGTPEDIRYYVMDRADRKGSRTGALDVGAKAGAEVYAPVSGVVTAIRPDPTMQAANIIEIKPSGRTDLRFYVSLVEDPSGDIGPGSPVVAGTTLLGTVADSAAVLDPQLSSYTKGPGNHVTIFALQVG